jgi:hypothetical protein
LYIWGCQWTSTVVLPFVFPHYSSRLHPLLFIWMMICTYLYLSPLLGIYL